jgi:hypothetical protein
MITLIKICLADTYKVLFNVCKTCSSRSVTFELLVRKLMAVRSCQEGENMELWHLEIFQ